MVDRRKSWSDIDNEWDCKAGGGRHVHHQRATALADEEKKLHEERRRIEEAQRQLQFETERLAAERRRLEVRRAADQSALAVPVRCVTNGNWPGQLVERLWPVEG